MREFWSTSGSRSFLRLTVVALLGGTAAACSSDVGRFQNPDQSPFAAQSGPAYTGSIASAPTGQVQSAPMAAPSYGAPQPVSSSAYGAPAYGAPQPQRPYGATSSYGSQPAYNPPRQQVASLSPPQQQPLYGTYQASQAAALARQPAPAAAQAAPVQAAVAAARPAAANAAAGAGHVIASGETLSSLSRRYGVSRSDIAAANGLDANAQVQIGQRVVIPGVSAAQMAAHKPAAPAPAALAAPVAAAKPVAAATSTVTAAATTPVTTTAPAPAVVAAAPAKPATPAKPAAPAVAAAPAEPKAQTIAAVKPSEPMEEETRAASGVQFRWPVRGRIISGYGPKPGGQSNEGINVSVPEGTSVKAAEDGVVAYAGSELKGYGNLVLVKHSDGWVTAYAHNSAVEVKKGDTVKRGQVIAKAGQTGNVTSPQVHFEIRKGSQAVDPSQYLAGL